MTLREYLAEKEEVKIEENKKKNKSKKKKEIEEDAAITTVSIGGAAAQFAPKFGETFKRIDDKKRKRLYDESTLMGKVDILAEEN